MHYLHERNNGVLFGLESSLNLEEEVSTNLNLESGLKKLWIWIGDRYKLQWDSEREFAVTEEYIEV